MYATKYINELFILKVYHFSIQFNETEIVTLNLRLVTN